MSESVIDAYILFRANPDNDDREDSYFVTLHNFTLPQIREAKKANPSWAKAALDARRTTYAAHMLKIDKALFQAAEKGDVRAARLLYQRFDGWDPDAEVQNNNFNTFADMVRMLIKKIPENKKITQTIDVDADVDEEEDET